MAIGQVRPGIVGARQLRQGPGTPVLASFGEGIATAVNNLSTSFGEFMGTESDLTNQMVMRNRKRESLDLSTRFLEFQAADARAYEERKRAAPATGQGFTNAELAYQQERQKEFLAGVPEYARQEWSNTFTEYAKLRSTEAFTYELSLSDQHEISQLKGTLSLLGSQVKANGMTLDKAENDFRAVLSQTNLPPDQQEQMFENGRNALATLAFGNSMEEFMSGFTPVDTGRENDVRLGGVDPLTRGALNAIAGPESSDRWNVINGGQIFTDFSDHPRVAVRQEDGTISTAAGRYQILASTWDWAVKGLAAQGVVISDFEPTSQDKVAAYILETRFNSRARKAGINMTYEQIMRDPSNANLDILKGVLEKEEWIGLQKLEGDEFHNVVRGLRGLAGGGTPTATAPDPFTDPRFAHIPIEQKMSLAADMKVQVNAKNSAMQEQAKRDQEAALQQAEDWGYNGSYGLSDLESLRMTVDNFDDEAERRFRKGVADREAKEVSTREVSGLLQSGAPIPAGKYGAAFDDWIGDNGRKALAAMDPVAAGRIGSAAISAGYLPKMTGEVLMGMANGAEAPERIFAMQTLAGMNAVNPNFLRASGFSEDDISRVVAWDAMSGGRITAEQADEVFQQQGKLFPGKSQTQINQDANDAFNEAFESTSVLDSRDTWMPFDEETPTLVGAQIEALNYDARKFFQQGYRLTGNVEGAKAYMEKQLAGLWQKSPYGAEGRTMRNAPESIYPPVYGSHGWIEDSVRAGMELPEGVDRDSVSYELIADPQTEAEIAAWRASGADPAKAPSYQVFTRDQTGAYLPAGRWRASPTAFDEAIKNEGTRIDDRNTLSRARQAATIYDDKQREYTELREHFELVEPKLTPEERTSMAEAVEVLRREADKAGVTAAELSEQAKARGFTVEDGIRLEYGKDGKIETTIDKAARLPGDVLGAAEALAESNLDRTQGDLTPLVDSITESVVAASPTGRATPEMQGYELLGQLATSREYQSRLQNALRTQSPGGKKPTPLEVAKKLQEQILAEELGMTEAEAKRLVDLFHEGK